jgi:hypothetical protein
MTSIPVSALSYNQPKFSRNASWDADAITILNSSQLPYGPMGIFVNKNNTWYIAPNGYNQLVHGVEATINPSTLASVGLCVFVSASDEIFTNDGEQVTMWSMNRTFSRSVMFTNNVCRGLFVSMNNTLYCSLTQEHQVIAKSLDDPANMLTMVAGTGCSGLSVTQLNYPHGIFVDHNSNIYVADAYNHRIQLFYSGQTSATTVAGTGAPSTITFLYPSDVKLDGDGYLFVVDTNNRRIIGSGPDGFRCVAGCSGVYGSASNQLSNPHSMSFDSDGNIWVADLDNLRIQKFLLRTNCCGEYRLVL